MRIFVTAKAGAKKECIEKINSTHYRVAVCATAHHGSANEAIIKSLANYFDISRSRICLIAGVTSKNKTFDIK